MTEKLIIDYYTDVLCVWAWIAQPRIELLEERWGAQVDLRHHCMNVFGDTANRVGRTWADKGGYEGFARHVRESAEPYDEAVINPNIWAQVRPATSANAHLVLKAVKVTSGGAAATNLALQFRKAFFVDARDIGDLGVLIEIARGSGCSMAEIRQSIENGTAAAALMDDYQAAQSNKIAGSPSWVMNNGRQKLYGNVGYQVLHANVEGILNRHEGGASWC
jgi:predicted DsbA family dithiol-disulfide isomerase